MVKAYNRSRYYDLSNENTQTPVSDYYKPKLESDGKIDLNNSPLYYFTLKKELLNCNLKSFQFKIVGSDSRLMSKSTMNRIFIDNPHLYRYSKGTNYNYMMTMDFNYQPQITMANFKSYFDNNNPNLKLEILRNIINKYHIITSYLNKNPQSLEYYYMYNNILEGLLNKNYFKFTPIFEYKDVSTLNEVQGTIKLN